MATKKQLEEFTKRKRAGMTGMKGAKARREQRQKNPELTAEKEKIAKEVAAFAIPGLGALKVGKILATARPGVIKQVKEALNKKDNIDALRSVFGLDKKVGKNLVKPRLKKGPDGKRLGARPISKAAQKKAKQTRTALATTAAGAAALTFGPEKSKKGKQPLIEAGQVEAPPKVTPLIQDKKQTEPKLDGSEYAPYPGAAGRAGFEYGRDIGEVLADETVSPEIKERLEEEIIYEGDYKGGRVGKGKKMKMKKGGSPKGCGKARRGYGKAMMGGGMVKTKRGYSGGGRLY